jgi:DNA mismatch endonuclease, patch repair protein
MPGTRQDYWIPKFERTVERDKRNQEELRRLGWHVIVLWECEIKDINRLTDKLMNSITYIKRQYSQDTAIFKMAAESQGSY